MPEVRFQLVAPHPDAPGPREFHVVAESVRHALIQAGTTVVALRPDGRALAPGVVVFRNGQDVRYAGGMEAPLSAGDRLLVVVPATDS
jgi:hypothetical protein